MVNLDLQTLLENLRQWPRSKAWQTMLQDPNMPPDVRHLLKQHIRQAEIIEHWQNIPVRPVEASRASDLPRYIQPGKKIKSRAKSGLCRGCGKPLPHDVTTRRHLWLMRQKYWGKRWWSKQSPETRKARTKAASKARWAKHWDDKLKSVNPRLLKLYGRAKCIELLRAISKPRATAKHL